MVNKRKESSVGNNYLYSLIYQAVNIIVQVVLLHYLSIVIGSRGIGIQSYTNSIVSYFVMIGALGVNWYGQKEIAYNSFDNNKLSDCFWKLCTLKGLWSVFVFIFYVGLIIFSNKYRIYYIAMIFTYLAGILDISWFYQGIEKFDIIAIRNTIIKLLGMILILVFVKSKNDILLYVCLIAISNLVGNISMWFKLSDYISKPNNKCLEFKKYIKPSIQYFIPTIATTIYLTMDKTMIGLITKNDLENGYYEQSIQIVNMMKTIVLSYNTVMISRMSILYSKSSKKEILEGINNSLEFILTICWPIVFGFAAIERMFVQLYFGTENSRIGDILFVFCPIILIVGISNMVESHIITPLNKRKIGNQIVIIGALFNFILNLILINIAGAKGAATASVAAELLIMVLYIKESLGLVKWKNMISASIKKVIASLIMFCTIVLFNYYIRVSILFGLIVSVILGICIYAVCLFILRDHYFLSICKNFILKLSKRRK